MVQEIKMTPEKLLNQLIKNMPSGGNYNAYLDDGKYVFEAFVDHSIYQPLKLIQGLTSISKRLGEHHDIRLDLSKKTKDGASLASKIFKENYLSHDFKNILQPLFEIDSKLGYKIDWNEEIFPYGSTLAHRIAEYSVNSLKSLTVLLSFKGPDFLPLIDVNKQNADSDDSYPNGRRVIDYFKERIEVGARAVLHEAFISADMQNQLHDMVNILRAAGSKESLSPFSPEHDNLDTQLLHVKTNNAIVRRIHAELRNKHPEIDVKKSIAELQKCIGSHDTLDPETRKQAQDGFSRYVEEFGDKIIKESNFDSQTFDWNYKTEIAYLWEEAKSRENELGLIATLAKVYACHWGVIVNLYHTAEAQDTSDLKEHEYVIDFDQIISVGEKRNVDLQKEISNRVFAILKGHGIPDENMQVILKKWKDAHEEMDGSSPARDFVDGAFSEALTELVAREVGEFTRIYSADFVKWSMVVSYIAVSYYENDPGNTIYNLIFDEEFFEFIKGIFGSSNIRKQLVEFHSEYGKIDLSKENRKGISALELLLQKGKENAYALEVFFEEDELVYIDLNKHKETILDFIYDSHNYIHALPAILMFFFKNEGILEEASKRNKDITKVHGILSALHQGRVKAEDFHGINYEDKQKLSRDDYAILYGREVPKAFRKFVNLEFTHASSVKCSRFTPKALLQIPREYRDLKENVINYVHYTNLNDIRELLIHFNNEHIEEISQKKWPLEQDKFSSLYHPKKLSVFNPMQLKAVMKSDEVNAYLEANLKWEDFLGCSVEKLDIVLTPEFRVLIEKFPYYKKLFRLPVEKLSYITHGMHVTLIHSIFREIFDPEPVDYDKQDIDEIVQFMQGLPKFQNKVTPERLVKFARKVKVSMPELKSLSEKAKAKGMELLCEWLDYISRLLSNSPYTDGDGVIEDQGVQFPMGKWLYHTKGAITRIGNGLYEVLSSKTPPKPKIPTKLCVEHLAPFSDDEVALLFTSRADSFLHYAQVRSFDELNILSEKQKQILLKSEWHCVERKNYFPLSARDLSGFSCEQLEVIVSSYVSREGLPDFVEVQQLQKLPAIHLAILLSDERIIAKLPEDLDFGAFALYSSARLEEISEVILDELKSANKRDVDTNLLDPRTYDDVADDVLGILLTSSMRKLYREGAWRLEDFNGIGFNEAYYFASNSKKMVKFFKENDFFTPGDFAGCNVEVIKYFTQSKYSKQFVRYLKDSAAQYNKALEKLSKAKVIYSIKLKEAKVKNAPKWKQHDAKEAKDAVEKYELDAALARELILKPNDFAFCDASNVKAYSNRSLIDLCINTGMKPQDFFGLDYATRQGGVKIRHLEYFSSADSKDQLFSAFQSGDVKPYMFRHCSIEKVRELTSSDKLSGVVEGIYDDILVH